jgi:18S rRNA (guanine1575-N7)-methyltransferase
MSLSRGARPERTAAAEAFYDPAEASKYEDSARMGKTQRHLAERALHLLDLRQPGAMLLDLGCGTGFSGAPLERAGHAWIGLDVSEYMLKAARAPSRRRDLLCADIGAPLWLRKRVFDGAVSISAVQWLCHATKAGHDPAKRVRQFFRGLKAVLVPEARAVLQIYPEHESDMMLLRDKAVEAGFTGSLIIDYPRSERSKKLFLVLVAPAAAVALAAAKPAGGAKQRAGGKGVRAGNSGGSRGGVAKGKGRGGEGRGGGRGDARRRPKG